MIFCLSSKASSAVERRSEMLKLVWNSSRDENVKTPIKSNVEKNYFIQTTVEMRFYCQQFPEATPLKVATFINSSSTILKLLNLFFQTPEKSLPPNWSFCAKLVQHQSQVKRFSDVLRLLEEHENIFHHPVVLNHCSRWNHSRQIFTLMRQRVFKTIQQTIGGKSESFYNSLIIVCFRLNSIEFMKLPFRCTKFPRNPTR